MTELTFVCVRLELYITEGRNASKLMQLTSLHSARGTFMTVHV
jgi:hypothetical protein